MRRMITEKDVEKLDSIKPSEIEKLGKITDADIESVKATQSPIGATAGYVLTADGKGKATYKQSQSGMEMKFVAKRPNNIGKWNWSSLESNPGYPGYKTKKINFLGPNDTQVVYISYDSFPHYKNSRGETVYLKPGDYFITKGYLGVSLVGISDAAYAKFNEDVVANNTVFDWGIDGYGTFEQ